MVDLFTVANASVIHTLSEDSTNTVQPLRTFSTSWAAFNLGWWPDISQISVDSLTGKYNLLDLCPALVDFLSKYVQNVSAHHIGGWRQSQEDSHLPFDNVMVWYSLHLHTHWTTALSLSSGTLWHNPPVMPGPLEDITPSFFPMITPTLCLHQTLGWMVCLPTRLISCTSDTLF